MSRRLHRPSVQPRNTPASCAPIRVRVIMGRVRWRDVRLEDGRPAALTRLPIIPLLGRSLGIEVYCSRHIHRMRFSLVVQSR